MKRNIKYISLLVIIIILVLLLILIISKTKSKDNLTHTIRVAAYKGDVSGLIFIADQMGIFTDNGLHVEITNYSSGKAALDAVDKGDADIASCSEFVFVKDSMTHCTTSDNCVIGSFAKAKLNWLIARTDAGIESIANLKNKRVAVKVGSIAEYYLGRLLNNHDLSLNDVLLTDMEPSQIITSMANGSIDATTLWEPNISMIESAMPDKTIKFDAQQNQDFYFILVSSNQWLDENLDNTKKFLKSLYSAEMYFQKNTDSSIQLLSDYTKTSIEQVKENLNNERLFLTFPQNLIVIMDSEKRWLSEKQGIANDQVPELLEVMRPEIMKTIIQERVTIIKK